MADDFSADEDILTPAEIAQRKNPPAGSALNTQDLDNLDAEVTARDNALSTSLNRGVQANPDQAAKTKALSVITGLPTDVVERNPELIEQKARVQQLRSVLANSPILARQMADPEFAKLAHDDVENLGFFEQMLRTYLGASLKSGIENLLGTGAKVLDAVQPFSLSEQDAAVLAKNNPKLLADLQNSPAMFLSRFSRAMQQASQATMKNVNQAAKVEYGDLQYATLDPEKAAYLRPIKVVGDAIQSLPTTLALMVSAYMTKGVANRVEQQALAEGLAPEVARRAAIHAAAETMAKLGAITEGAAGFGQQAIQTREQAEEIPQEKLDASPEYRRLIMGGYSPEAARLLLSAQAADLAGAAGGVADAITNYYGGRILGGIIGEGGALAKRVGKGFATEGVQEAAQSGLEQLGQNAAVQKFLDPQQELMDGVAEQIAMGFTVGGVMGGAFGMAAGRRKQGERTQAQLEALQKMFDAAGADKLRERSPADFARYLQSAADEEGVSAVYVNANIFAQAAQEKGLDIAASMPETAKQLSEALAMDGDLRVPLGEAMASLSGSGLEKVLMQNMRLTPDAPTLEEVQNKKFVADTQAAVERVLADQDISAAQKDSSLTVENELLAQLTRANRFTKDVNGAYARLMASFYTVQAARIGISPEEMYVRYPLRIEAEPVTGERIMEQPGTPKFEEWSQGAPVVNYDAMRHYEGGPAVFKVFHGTTADFSSFERERANPESDLGAGLYMTNNPDDVSVNYAGQGPDLTSKIERLAEQIQQESESSGKPISMAQAKRNAKKQLKVEHGGAVMPVYVAMQNPAIIGGPNETVLTYEQKFDDEGEPTGDEEGTLVDFILNLRNAASRYYDADGVESAIDDLLANYESLPLSEAMEILNKNEKFNYVTDDKGTLMRDEIIREALELTGFDGIVDYTVNKKFGTERKVGKSMTSVDEDTVHVVAFKPEQIKSVFNEGTYNPSDANILKQDTIDNDTGEVLPNAPFYSALSMQVAAAKFEIAPPAQWKAFINSLASKGVKKDEITLSGVLDWLDSIGDDRGVQPHTWAIENADKSVVSTGVSKEALELYNLRPGQSIVPLPTAPKNERIPKQAVIDYLAKNGVQVQTKILGAPKEEQEGYQPPTSAPAIQLTNDEYAQEGAERNPLELMHRYRGRDSRGYQSDEGTDYRELVIGVPSIEAYNANDTTHFGHVFEGKTIAWARIKVQYAAEGERKVLFVEELQSQRAQHGREEGFRLSPEEKQEQQNKWNVLRERYQAISAEMATLPQEQGATTEAITRYAELGREQGRITDEMNAIQNRGRSGVPPAPYVTDTQAWVGLTLKRLIRYAVDKGLKRIVWTPGAQQVHRYQSALLHEVDAIHWKKTESGVEIKAMKGGEEKLTQSFAADKLRHTLGPAMAQDIVNDPSQDGVILGDSLRIEDLGMVNFYGDERGLNVQGKPALVTIVANRISKSLGGGEVREVKMDDLSEHDRVFPSAPGFDITPQMEAAAKKGLPLFQGDRGQLAFGSDIKEQPSVITLLKNADLSTFLHESGHFYLEVLSDMATQPDAPAEVMGDMQRVLDWFGVPDIATWQAMTLEQKRPFHEQFARGFESYIFEGRAPSRELQGLFSRFRAWLVNVYRQLTALNVTLTDEVRSVFNRLLATNNEILAAEAMRGYAPLFNSAEEMGATAEEWKDYQEQGAAATQEAVELLQKRSLRDMKWLSNARGRILKKLQGEAAAKRKAVTAEVTTEVREQPVYAAIRFLTHGELPEANRTNAERRNLDAMAGHPSKLSIPYLRAMYGDGPAAPWRYLNTGRYGHIVANDGLNPNMVAELFGFTSGDHLVRSILDAQPEADVIQGMTDQRMLERYGDLSHPDAIEAAADEAIHNEARAKFLATEARALSKAAGQRNIIFSAAKEFAATLIARKKLAQIRPAPYESAEARAGRNAATAKSLVEKATEKRNQLVNHYAARAAYAALDEIERGVSYLRRVGESKTIDPEYREQIQALLDRFDLRPLTAKDARRRESLLQWMEEQKKLGFEPVIDADLIDEASRRPYRDLSLEEFRGLVDAVKNIEHLGRLKHRLISLQKQREFAAVVDEAASAIDANAKRTIKAPIERTKWVKMKSGVKEFFALHRKFAMMMREMDGHKDNGVLWNLFVRPMNLAGDHEAVMREAATKKLQALLAPVLKEGKMSEKRFIPEINNSLSREGRIMVALNMGNEGNLQRLLDGDAWSIGQAQAILNTLTKTEMDFVQGVWDYVGSYRGEIGEQQKRITGVEPEWVEPRAVQTIHGEYRGGYLPAKYDTTRSTRSLSDEAASGIMDMWRAKRGAAKTRDSFTKERANKVVNRPLRKDFGVITQHVTEVTHRLAWQEYLIDAQRLLRAPKIDNAIRDHYGPEVLKTLRDTLEDVAAGEVAAQNAFESGINYIRTGATIAGLGWRITTALLQPIGLTQSMVRIGPKYVARGLVEWLGDAAKMENTAKRIFEKSNMMRLRSNTMQREISEIRNKISGKNSAIEASFFYLITKMQLVADIPTWLGQYHKAVEKGADEASAVAQADQAVLDAQSGGQIKDLSGIQRGGPMMKLFTNFYSFFNTTYNLTSDAVGRTKFKDPFSVAMLAVDLLLLYSVPAVLGTLMKAALHSGDDGQDDRKLIRQLIADQLTYMLGTMVGLREVAGAAQTALGLPGDYQGPASVRVFASLAELGKQANQGEVDEALLKAANNVAGILFHYPAGQIGATVDGIVTMADGKTTNPGALIVGSNKK